MQYHKKINLSIPAEQLGFDEERRPKVLSSEQVEFITMKAATSRFYQNLLIYNENHGQITYNQYLAIIKFERDFAVPTVAWMKKVRAEAKRKATIAAKARRAADEFFDKNEFADSLEDYL